MTRRTRRLATAAAVVSAIALQGCSLALKVPTRQPAPPATRTALSSPSGVPAATHNEIPTPAGPEEHTPATADSAPAAVRAFATRYINWTAADVRVQLRALAQDSVGQARSAMALAAQQTGSDPELAEAGVINRGVVEAVAPLGGGGDRWVVVTRESTTATRSSAYQGLAPAWHLAVASVVRRGQGWVVSGWQPED